MYRTLGMALIGRSVEPYGKLLNSMQHLFSSAWSYNDIRLSPATNAVPLRHATKREGHHSNGRDL